MKRRRWRMNSTPPAERGQKPSWRLYLFRKAQEAWGKDSGLDHQYDWHSFWIWCFERGLH